MAMIKLTPEHHERWNKFAFKHHWFFHRTEWLEYLMNSKKDVEFIDHSFFVQTGQNITNIVPLIQEGDKLISPGFDDEREIVKEVNRIAQENGIKHIQVNADIKKYLSVPSYTCILDLDDIRLSKGHKSSIKKAEQFLTCHKGYDVYSFRKYYINYSKEYTRPYKTFDLLGEWIRKGFGTLLEALFEGKIVGYIYILHYKDYSYYFMSCTPQPYKQYNVTHFLMSKAFDILREKGIKEFELGEQVYNSLEYQPTEKERSISLFKRNFGGTIEVKSASEYFMDQTFMIETYANRLHKYWENKKGN
jgi:hypothetical protein